MFSAFHIHVLVVGNPEVSHIAIFIHPVPERQISLRIHFLSCWAGMCVEAFKPLTFKIKQK